MILFIYVSIYLSIYLFIYLPPAILAFVIVKDGVTDSEESVFEGLKKMVKVGVGSFAVPHQFLVRPLFIYHVIL